MSRKACVGLLALILLLFGSVPRSFADDQTRVQDAHVPPASVEASGKGYDIRVFDDVIAVMGGLQRGLLDGDGYFKKIAWQLLTGFALVGLIAVFFSQMLGGGAAAEGILPLATRTLAFTAIGFAVLSMWTPKNLEMVRTDAVKIGTNVVKSASQAIGQMRGGDGVRVQDLGLSTAAGSTFYDEPSQIMNMTFGFGKPVKTVKASGDGDRNILERQWDKLKGAVDSVKAAAGAVLHLGALFHKIILTIVIGALMAIVELYIIGLNIEWYIVTTVAVLMLPLIALPGQFRSLGWNIAGMCVSLFFKFIVYSMFIAVVLAVYKMIMASTLNQYADSSNLTAAIAVISVANSQQIGTVLLLLILLVAIVMAMPMMVSRITGGAIGMPGALSGRLIGATMAVVGGAAMAGGIPTVPKPRPSAPGP